MGCWGCDVLQSDTSYDILDSLKEKIGTLGITPDEDSDSIYPYWSLDDLHDNADIQQKFKDAVKEIWPDLIYWVKERDEYQVLAAQVLAVTMVAAGMDIDLPVHGYTSGDGTLKFREAVIARSKEEVEMYREVGAEKWAITREAFVKAIEDYDGTPAMLGGGGLMEAFAEKLGM